MEKGESYQFSDIAQEAQVILLSQMPTEWKEKMLWRRNNINFRVKPNSDGLSVLIAASKCKVPETIHSDEYVWEEKCKTNISQRWKQRKLKRDEESARLLLLCK